MRRSHSLLLLVSMLAMLGAAADSQQSAPREPFRLVHFVTLTADDAALLLVALADVNAALDQAGHSEVHYRLYKVVGKQSGDYSYMWESSWPSDAVYDEVLKTPAFLSALKRHPITERVRKNEIFNRYVEVTSPKP
jgi:hypothetical protein